MKFFVPDTNDPLSIWGMIRTYNAENAGWEISFKKIYSIHYHNAETNKNYFIKIGETHPINNEKVVAILDTNTFLICTKTRGQMNGNPIMVGKDDVMGFEEFDE